MASINLYNKRHEIVAQTLVDDEYIPVLKNGVWHRDVYGYASGLFNGRTTKLHRVVYELAYGDFPVDKPYVDHINRIRLDNRKSNLRAVNPLENVLNRSSHINNTTGYFGVRLDKRTKRYQAYVTISGRWHNIGYFEVARDAAIAYDITLINGHPNGILTLNVSDASDEDKRRIIQLMSQPKKRRGKSQYLGVIYFSYDNRVKRWHARIAHNKQQYRLGYYLTEREAAEAYNRKAIELYGSEAVLNVL